MSTHTTQGHAEDRDEELGAALRRLEVPAHRVGFDADVLAELRAVAAARDQVGSRPRVSALDDEDRGRPWRRSVIRQGLAAAAAVLVVAVVGSDVLAPQPPPTGPPGATETPPVELTATMVRSAVAETWTTIDTVSGSISVTDRDGRRDWSFAVTAEGDFHLVDETRGGQTAYDAQANVEWSLQPSESMDGVDILFASRRRGLAPGAPDPAPAQPVLQRHVGAAVRAIVGDGNDSVEEIEFDGRPAWLLDTDVPPDQLAPDHGPSHLRVTVDQATGFPVRVVATNAGEQIYETRVSSLEINQPLGEQQFRLAFPPDAEVSQTDHGFRDVPLADVPTKVGYAPLVPTWMPEGFDLDVVRVGTRPTPTGAAGTNPPVDDVVSISFRRGLDHTVITLRPAGGDPESWSDPLSAGERLAGSEATQLTAGHLDGHTAEVTIGLLTPPHLWAATDDLVVTVAGDVDRDQLLRIANSLETQP